MIYTDPFLTANRIIPYTAQSTCTHGMRILLHMIMLNRNKHERSQIDATNSACYCHATSFDALSID
jgi:hypothetical protein